jgi:hypothetical protein
MLFSLIILSYAAYIATLLTLADECPGVNPWRLV